jgi:hypothetical protein
MTIAIAGTVSEGIVLASDSAALIVEQRPDGEPVVAKVYANAQRIFALSNEPPVGLLTWGIGNIGASSIPSLVGEFKKQHAGNLSETDFSLEAKGNAFRQFLAAEYHEAFGKWNTKPEMGFLLCGFSPDSGLAELWRMEVVNGDFIGPDLVRQPGTYGVDWFGAVEAVHRLVVGYSPSFFDDVVKKMTEPFKEEASSMYVTHLMHPAMPLSDAIKAAEYLIDVSIGFFRFSPGYGYVLEPVQSATLSKSKGFCFASNPTGRLFLEVKR